MLPSLGLTLSSCWNLLSKGLEDFSIMKKTSSVLVKRKYSEDQEPNNYSNREEHVQNDFKEEDLLKNINSTVHTNPKANDVNNNIIIKPESSKLSSNSASSAPDLTTAMKSSQPISTVSNSQRPKQVFIPPPKYQQAYQQWKRKHLLSLCHSYQRQSNMTKLIETDTSLPHNSQCSQPKENGACFPSHKKRKLEQDTKLFQSPSQGVPRTALADISAGNTCLSQNVTNTIYETRELKKEGTYVRESIQNAGSENKKIPTFSHTNIHSNTKLLSQIEPYLDPYLGKQIINKIDLGKLFLKTADLHNILGKQYPLIGKIHGGPDNGFYLQIDNDGTVTKQTSSNSSSVYQSYTRLGRILMSLGLGRAMLYLQFQHEYISSHANDVEHICKHGIDYNGTRYKLFTASNSSLCSRTGLSLFISSHIDHLYLVSMLGNFSEAAKKGPRKALSRLALNSGKSYFCRKQLRPEELFVLDDEKDFPGVDGCGFAREDYFKDILKLTEKQPFLHDDGKVSRLIHDNEIDNIVAIQFRVGGFKGVLQSIPMKFWSTLKQKYGFQDSIRCVMRKSMEKFIGNTDIYSNFDVLEVSKVCGGSINLHFMSCMLQLTSNREEMENIFLQRLDEYLVEKLCLDPENRSQLKHSAVLNDINSSATFEQDSVYNTVKRLLLAGHKLDNPFIHKWIMKRMERKCQALFFNHLSLKFKIKKCVNLVGVIDETGKLGPNQVFIACPKIRNTLGEREYHNLRQVIVYRNPLAYQGDIMKLEIVTTLPNTFTAEEAEYMASRENVIVFPKCYRQKSIHQFMGGGDLDGDRYVIIFDQELISLFDKEAPKVDYDSHPPIINEPSKPVSHYNVIDEHVSCIINKDNLISDIFYCNMLVRESNDIETKMLLAKALADAIDSKRAHHIDFRKLILETKQKFKEPAWYLESSKVKVSQARLFDSHTFEFRMMNLIIETYSSIKYQPNHVTIDRDLVVTRPKKCNAILEKQWKEEFTLAHNKWTEYWIHFCSMHKESTNFNVYNKYNMKEKIFQKSLKPFLDEFLDSNSQRQHPSNHHLRPQQYWTDMFHSNGLLATDAPYKASIWLQAAYELEKRYMKEEALCPSQLPSRSTILSLQSSRSMIRDGIPVMNSSQTTRPLRAIIPSSQQPLLAQSSSYSQPCNFHSHFSQCPSSTQRSQVSILPRRKSILSSPFLYYCCLTELNLLKTTNSTWTTTTMCLSSTPIILHPKLPFSLSASVCVYAYLQGRISGMSGIAGCAFRGLKNKLLPSSSPNRSVVTEEEFAHKILYILGLMVAGFTVWFLEMVPDHFVQISSIWLSSPSVWVMYLVAGLLGGFGTQLGNGCTSGMMICGIARLSIRGFVSTMVFCSVAFVCVKYLRSIEFVAQNLINIGQGVELDKPFMAFPTMEKAVLIFLYFLLLISIYMYILRRVQSWSDNAQHTLDFYLHFYNGLVFGSGLALSGMTNPMKVLGFFDIGGENYDPSLFCVAIFAILPSMFVFQKYVLPRAAQHEKPPISTKYHMPTSNLIDWKLIAGAAIFGVSWGMAGVCPGPWMTSLGSLNPLYVIFGVGFGAGIYFKDMLRV
ncbi:hypothetical protein C9374_000687 [Naegleria lovaniensis]|uniref:RDRP core domain-containing protein n=1 Tax=Naegleria lovaniensis TaxID=51637 RepID=A0AA88KNG4_NAELO|nr:uncharacterized protein C9374_000687 [Naegleria lovaniensis]KAG2388523.1 hypothetical protein C9374_000687 [Naegleria lovaniensis]